MMIPLAVFSSAGKGFTKTLPALTLPLMLAMLIIQFRVKHLF
jgi:hypothetical protein